jgi:hypothetical protein
MMETSRSDGVERAVVITKRGSRNSAAVLHVNLSAPLGAICLLNLVHRISIVAEHASVDMRPWRMKKRAGMPTNPISIMNQVFTLHTGTPEKYMVPHVTRWDVLSTRLHAAGF